MGPTTVQLIPLRLSARLIREKNARHPKSARPKISKEEILGRNDRGIGFPRISLDSVSRAGLPFIMHSLCLSFSFVSLPLSRSLSLSTAYTRAGFDGRTRTIVRTARSGRTHRVYVRATGYINYTCKYTGGRLKRSNCEISRYVLAILHPAPFPLFASPSAPLEPGLAHTHARTHAYAHSTNMPWRMPLSFPRNRTIDFGNCTYPTHIPIAALISVTE